jgi:hypothetical protein
MHVAALKSDSHYFETINWHVDPRDKEPVYHIVVWRIWIIIFYNLVDALAKHSVVFEQITQVWFIFKNTFMLLQFIAIGNVT